MSASKPRLPECYYCRFNDLGYPCRTYLGELDFALIGETLVQSGRQFTEDGLKDERAYAGLRWAADCVFEIEQHHPELMLPLVVAAIDACETLEDAAYIAAGPVENMAVKHGPALIDRIEALAARSAKFRYVLSGIWSQAGSIDHEVWARIGRAVGKGGRMSSDGRGPWDGRPVTVLTDEDAQSLLEERVADSAKGLI